MQRGALGKTHAAKSVVCELTKLRRALQRMVAVVATAARLRNRLAKMSQKQRSPAGTRARIGLNLGDARLLVLIERRLGRNRITYELARVRSALDGERNRIERVTLDQTLIFQSRESPVQLRAAESRALDELADAKRRAILLQLAQHQ